MAKHIYRKYDTLGVTICLNCTKFKYEVAEDACVPLKPKKEKNDEALELVETR